MLNYCSEPPVKQSPANTAEPRKDQCVATTGATLVIAIITSIIITAIITITIIIITIFSSSNSNSSIANSKVSK